jgi:hypothetical protein
VFSLWIGLVPSTFLKPSAAAVRSATARSAAAFAARMEGPAPAAADQVVHLP